MNILNRVLTEIRKNEMIEHGDKVIIGVSGGPDSVALLDILTSLSDWLDITICVAHLNHMFRGKEADEDAALVARLAEKYGLEIVVEKRDVPAYMREKHLSAQDAARRLRFDFLDEVAKRLGGNRIALGHHADDQAETVLINFLRGTGLSGLKGMLPVRDRRYIRPLLTLRRSEILEYCKERGLQYRIDSSNVKPVYIRNRIRLKLIPLLESEYNKNIVWNLNRLSIICRDEDDFIENKAFEIFEKIKTKSSSDVLSIKIDKLLKEPAALQRRVIRMVYRELKSFNAELSFVHVEKVLAMAQKKDTGGCIELPGGVRAEKNYGSIDFVCHNADNIKSMSFYCYRLAIPGVTYIPELDLTVLAEVKSIGQEHIRPDLLPANEVLLDYDIVGPALFVRPRKPGDIFNPLGIKGKVKLKKFLINNKIPFSARDKIPIFTNEKDIVWVGSVRPADICRVSGNTKNILHLKLLAGEFR